MWGQELFYHKPVLSLRIIPTRVGTSLGQLSHIALYEDHPHACGDKTINRAERGKEKGSSPRVWGQVGDFMNDLIKSRIIPTRVGTRVKEPR